MASNQQQQMQHAYADNKCTLRVFLDGAQKSGRHTIIENIRNCDIFVEDHNFFFYVDVQLFKFHSHRQLDVKDMKNLVIKFDSKTRSYEVSFPCLPQTEEDEHLHIEKSDQEKKSNTSATRADKVELWKLKRITNHCQLQLDDKTERVKFEADFAYGFANKFKGKISKYFEAVAISRMPEPQTTSPVQRSIDREIDELKNFSRDQYKLNFVELQVPDGHDNPMKFSINFEDNKLSRDEECLLHNLTRTSEHFQLPKAYDQIQIDCGLVDLLLSICYDIRSTSNEPTCESAWTRSILSPTLMYFESFDSIKDVVISFLRRSLIYPLYRNYDLGRLCVQDTVDALQKRPSWILKQLLVTHELFLSSDCNRNIFNHYYIDDYIRYVSNTKLCPPSHLQLLAYNLKNVLLDVFKKHLCLDLGEIETELLKELITDIHIGTSTSEEDTEEDYYDTTEDDDDGTESGEDETESSSASDTEENSVIEQNKST